MLSTEPPSRGDSVSPSWSRGGGKVLQLHVPAEMYYYYERDNTTRPTGFLTAGRGNPAYRALLLLRDATLDLSHRHRPRSAGEEGADAQADRDAEEEEQGTLIRRS